MHKKQIDNKDRELIEKVRAAVKQNQQKSIQSGSLGKTVKPWLPVLFIALIVASLWMFRQPSATTVPPRIVPDAHNAAQADMTATKDRSHGQPAAADLKALPPAPDTMAGQPVPIAPKRLPALQAAVTLHPAPPSPDAILQPAEPPQSKTAPPPKPLETGAAPPTARITGIAACRAVDQRQCVSPTTAFSLQETPTPVVWMNVLSDRQPFTLTHAYYLNGRKYCEVPLQIRYPRMRTWSNVTLAHSYQTGHWRVEVIDADGERLSQIEFTVTP
jgi:hypothetical protein